MRSGPGPAAAFDPAGPLPRGRYAIEASAGTGKTYALAGLATRYVIEEGIAVGELLVVTFTRAAAAELRDRVRAKLAEAATGLDAVIADPTTRPADAVVAHLCGADHSVRRDRARAALADFDAATITTIHGFAQQVLGTLGEAGGDPDATLGDDGGELLHQVCIDVLVAEALDGSGDIDLLPDLDTLLNAARKVTGNPDIVVVPGPDPGSSNEAAALRRRLIDRVVSEIACRRRRAGTLSFDDLLTRLRDALVDPTAGAAARDALRRRYRVALIDEFQDTDPVQWAIFSEVFGVPATGTTLVVVGDPKQAIYGFRGANVHTYLDAAHAPGTERATLAVNWRSDGALLEGLEGLLDGASFGDRRIEFQRVGAAPQHEGRRLRDRAGGVLPALSLRLAIGEDLPRAKRRPYAIKKDDAARAIFADLADRVRQLLDTATIATGGDDRELRPCDIAVLVAAHAESTAIRDALLAAGIPAVVASGDSVLRAPAAAQWRMLLEAVAQPADRRRARTACLSWFVGWTAAYLADAADAELAEVQERLHDWADVLLAKGAVDFLRTVRAESGVAARLLATADGDRSMTDLDHLAELLADAAPGRVGPAGLLAGLDRLKASSSGETEAEAAARRIESEADAVQIMTMHVSKGLEFGVVCCPSLWRPRPATADPDSVIYQDPVTNRRTVDVAGKLAWPDEAGAAARLDLAQAEAVGQHLRLLYVALTRARHQTIVWWTRGQNSEITALARVLFARDEAGRIDPEAFTAPVVELPADDEALDRLTPMIEAHAGVIDAAVIGSPPRRAARWSGPPVEPPAELAVAKLDHTPDRNRRRWSFSTIAHTDRTASVDPLDESMGDAAASDEGEEGDDDRSGGDRLAGDAGTDGAGGQSTTATLPLGPLPGGTEFGNLVHGVLEHVDFAAADLAADVGGQVAEGVLREGYPVDEQALTRGLCAAITTPLGPLAPGRALCDLTRRDRLDELGFELTLGESGTHADDAAVGRLVLRHLPAAHGLRPWAEGLAAGPFGARLAGHLVGFVDLVFRVVEPGRPDRFVVVDYKTNTLTRRGATPVAADYHPDRLPAAMAEHDYPLQALLYSVALHRYLRWRIAGYDPASHLGGIAYLFLRGMAGPDTPQVDGVPHGVFSWAPPAVLVTDLSDLLDGRVVGP